MGLASKLQKANTSSGAPMSQPPYGQPQTSQPPYGQPQTSQPPYGQPQISQPPYGQPQISQPPYGQPAQSPYAPPSGSYLSTPYGAPGQAPPSPYLPAGTPAMRPGQPSPYLPSGTPMASPYIQSGAPQMASQYSSLASAPAPYGAPGQNPHASAPGYPPQQGGYRPPNGPPAGYGAPSGYPPHATPSAPGGYPASAPATSGAQGGPSGPLLQKLEQTIQTNQLQRYYPAGSLQPIMNRLATINFRALSDEWRVPTELCYDLVALALYDIVVLCDDSGSMRFEDNGNRINELRRVLGKISQVATLFDDDGILIRFFNSPVEGNGIRNSQEADAIVSQVQFNGMTPMGTKLQSQVIDPFVTSALRSNSMSKPILVFVITDGEPSGEPRDQIFNVIRNCRQQVQSAGYGRGVAFQFAQVGKDAGIVLSYIGAQNFLNRLDNDAAFGDVVDTTSYYEMEYEEFKRKGVELTPELWLVKMMMGSVDPSYDEQD